MLICRLYPTTLIARRSGGGAVETKGKRYFLVKTMEVTCVIMNYHDRQLSESLRSSFLSLGRGKAFAITSGPSPNDLHCAAGDSWYETSPVAVAGWSMAIGDTTWQLVDKRVDISFRLLFFAVRKFGMMLWVSSMFSALPTWCYTCFPDTYVFKTIGLT